MDHIVKPDIVAPGNRLIATQAPDLTCRPFPANLIPLSYYSIAGGQQMSTDYLRLSGTSMAAPVVAGAIATMVEKEDSLTPDTIKARLMKTAFKGIPAASVYVDSSTGISYTLHSDMFTIGAGYLDVWAALNDTSVILPGNQASPTAVRDPITGAVSPPP